jgi:hypothetical protein
VRSICRRYVTLLNFLAKDDADPTEVIPASYRVEAQKLLRECADVFSEILRIPKFDVVQRDYRWLTRTDEVLQLADLL